MPCYIVDIMALAAAVLADLGHSVVALLYTLQLFVFAVCCLRSGQLPCIDNVQLPACGRDGLLVAQLWFYAVCFALLVLGVHHLPTVVLVGSHDMH